MVRHSGDVVGGGRCGDGQSFGAERPSSMWVGLAAIEKARWRAMGAVTHLVNARVVVITGGSGGAMAVGERHA